jgi:toxin ParE1/3/4
LTRFEVLLTADAAADLEEIYEYIALHDEPAKADDVLDRNAKVMQTLATFPGRGAYPKELVAMGVREYRQTFFKPYRVIYRIIGKRVYVYLIVDGRRDMQALLQRRLLGA